MLARDVNTELWTTEPFPLWSKTPLEYEHYTVQIKARKSTLSYDHFCQSYFSQGQK